MLVGGNGSGRRKLICCMLKFKSLPDSRQMQGSVVQRSPVSWRLAACDTRHVLPSGRVGLQLHRRGAATPWVHRRVDYIGTVWLASQRFPTFHPTADSRNRKETPCCGRRPRNTGRTNRFPHSKRTQKLEDTLLPAIPTDPLNCGAEPVASRSRSRQNNNALSHIASHTSQI